MNTIRFIVYGFFCSILSGCSGDYSVVLRNVGTNEITEAHVSYGNFESVGGRLPPGGTTVHHGNVPRRIPKVAIVEWSRGDGMHHRKEVEVRRIVSKDFKRGELVFEIDDSNEIRIRRR